MIKFNTETDGYNVEILFRDKGNTTPLYEVKFIKKSSQQSMPNKIDSTASLEDVENNNSVSQNSDLSIENKKKMLPEEQAELDRLSDSFYAGMRKVAEYNFEGVDGETRKMKENITISPNMSDEERQSILEKKEIQVAVYEGEADDVIDKNADLLESNNKNLVKKALLKIGDEFGIYGDYKNNDYDVEVSVSRGTIKESSSKIIDKSRELVKLFPKIKTALENAVGIEVHSNRYYADKDTIFFVEMISGFIDKNNYIPVRFGMKLSKSNKTSLYVMINQEGIEKAKVIKSVGSETPGAADSRLATLSIPQILSNVNTPDIIRYIPDGFLNEEKRKIKYKAISDTIVYTNKKNDAKYKQYIESGNMATAQAMVEQVAREKGYDKVFYNIIVTQYEPDSLKQYLNNNTVIYNKKTMNGKYQVGSGRVVASAHDMPFIANAIIPENSDLSTENNKKIKASPAVTKLNGLKMTGNASNIIIPENSNLSTENDKKYLEAVKNGDMATAQAMVEQAAREKGYDKGFYNIIVTQYEPDSLKQYLNNNTVIYNKKTMNGKYQVGSGRIVASAHDMPFIANTIVPKNSDLSIEKR